MTTAVIQVQGLCKTYRTGLIRGRKLQALAGVSLEVPSGTVFGLLGPNGAGKTTLIKILLGIVRQTAGHATVLNAPAGSRAARRQIGYLPENHRIPRHLTGDTALEYYGALSGLSLSEIRARRPALLELVGLRGRSSERVGGYSKGMLQRLGLAQAMLHRPQLIILDEPTDGVDPVGRKEIRDVLRQLSGEGVTVFLNSHLLQEIEPICDAVAILTQGTVRRTGSVRELTTALADAPVVLQLTGEEQLIRNALATADQVRLQQVTDQAFEVEIRVPSQASLDAVVDRLRAAGVSIWRMGRRELTLEEAFLEIVGAHP